MKQETVSVTLVKPCMVRGAQAQIDDKVEVLKHHAAWMLEQGVIKEAETVTRSSKPKTED